MIITHASNGAETKLKLRPNLQCVTQTENCHPVISELSS